ncbi:MAG: uvrD 1 [Marmoricola sp.]|nr:uvrD 1 [Marmoricola sp.]
MSAVSDVTPGGRSRPSVRLDGPEDLQRLMRAPFAFSEPQWRVVSAPLEPAVVIAGAGSGKTSVMAARVVYLVATGQVAPDEVLGLTFTTKATAELASRVRSALEDAGLDVPRPGGGVPVGAQPDEQPERVEPLVSTYNAYAASLLREHGLRIGHEPDTRVMADASRYQVAARAIERHTGAVDLLSEHPKFAIDYLLALDAELDEHLVTPAQVRAWHAHQRPLFETALATSRARTEITKALDKMVEREEILDLVEGYRALKAQFGVMDFSDQVALAAELARTQPEVGALERAKFRVVLLDEYQDTSVAQAQLLSGLFSGAGAGDGAGGGRGHAVTAVGDPNQAIYGWRGASVSNILNFGRFFPTATGAEVPSYSLTVNRRSDRLVVDVANALAAPLYEAFDQVEPLEAKPGAADGEVHAVRHQTYADELDWLAQEVLDEHAAMATPRWSEIGVLTRDNQHAADVFDALTTREVPVEIVGLKGLMRLPEVSEVISTLSLLQDLTANADVLNLLTGPRWAVGPRDLALLGKRARALAGTVLRPEGATVAEELQSAVEGADPTEVVSLCDALADPGDLPYSSEALHRFALLDGELRSLRHHVGEPLLDLVRRIVDVTGIDVELAASVSPAASARRDNLDLFVKAVADFQAIDGQVTLPSLLAWLQAEDEMGSGLDQATPSEADSVKLLTVHRAKGLEWDSVFLVGVCAEKFPVAKARSQWTTAGRVLPAPLRGDAADVPQLRGHDKPAIVALTEEARAHQAVEELRLGYVAFTRARHRLWVSSYQWSPTRQKPLAPSGYQLTVRHLLEERGLPCEPWPEPPAEGETNPLMDAVTSVPWPVTMRTAEHERRLVAADLVREAMTDLGPGGEDEELDLVAAATVAEWDAETERLLAEARADRSPVREVALPASLSATAVARLRDDPDRFARDLARPMPRQPSPQARFGTRFHAWVEARVGQQSLLDPDELPGRGDLGIEDEADLRVLVDAFEAGPFAERVPLATEAPFSLVLAGQVVRGRIDAVYAEGDGYLVVDWKTSREESADPLQLALYRLAWAELTGVPLEGVRAAFHYVRSGRTVEPRGLSDRVGLEALVSPEHRDEAGQGIS